MNCILANIYGWSALVALSLSSCRQMEHSEQVTSEVVAAQVEARNYARPLVSHDWSRDTTGLGEHVLAAYQRSDRYRAEGHPEQAAAFDSTFVKTVKAVRPELVDKIKRQ